MMDMSSMRESFQEMLRLHGYVIFGKTVRMYFNGQLGLAVKYMFDCYGSSVKSMKGSL